MSTEKTTNGHEQKTEGGGELHQLELFNGQDSIGWQSSLVRRHYADVVAQYGLGKPATVGRGRSASTSTTTTRRSTSELVSSFMERYWK